MTMQESSAQEYWRIQRESMLADPDRYQWETEESNRRIFVQERETTARK